jgi:hypothetical protein
MGLAAGKPELAIQMAQEQPLVPVRIIHKQLRLMAIMVSVTPLVEKEQPTGPNFWRRSLAGQAAAELGLLPIYPLAQAEVVVAGQF